MQRPTDPARGHPQQERGVPPRPLRRIHIPLVQINRLDQIPTTQINKGNPDEQLENLRGERRDLPHQIHQPHRARRHVHPPRPEARPEEEGKVVGVESLRESMGRPQQNGHGTGDPHDDQGLSREDGVEDADDGAAEEDFGGAEAVVGFAGHELGEDEGGDELDDEGEEGGVEDGGEGAGAGPVGAVEGEAGGEVGAEAEEGAEEGGAGAG
mmetsp:Transcript_4509/g.9209  ORF Transcript_4509/g.9209 Transcript_4509/m.9209 type:complete len:211 (-) Transcript_4509:338-970(-)